MDKPTFQIRKVARPGLYRMKCVYCKRFIMRKDLKSSLHHDGKVCKNREDCERARMAREEEG